MDMQGYVFFQGRLKDSLRRRGENISAWEVEAVINNYPEVLQSAVIGVPSDLGDDDIKAFVKVRDAERFAHADLANWCAERMPSYQVPRYIAVVSEFETTPTNRIRKESLSRSTTDCFDREADLSAEGVRARAQ
jgi:crotonobetaine/carnitine-CoA ligase